MSAKPKLQMKLNPTLVRRVVRKDDRFLCGICKNDYESDKDASLCLLRCWENSIKTSPMIVGSKNGVATYKCKLCARTYGTPAEAFDCTRDCVKQFSERVALELEISSKVRILASGDTAFLPSESMPSVQQGLDHVNSAADAFDAEQDKKNQTPTKKKKSTKKKAPAKDTVASKPKAKSRRNTDVVTIDYKKFKKEK